MDDPKANRELIRSKILHSKELTALEKRYLEGLVRNDIPHWIEDDYGFFHCSVCGWEFDDPEQTEPRCPNCRAKMEGGYNDVGQDADDREVSA